MAKEKRVKLEQLRLKVERLLKRLEDRCSEVQKDKIKAFIAEGKLLESRDEYTKALREYRNGWWILFQVFNQNIDEICTEKHVVNPDFRKKIRRLFLFFLIFMAIPILYLTQEENRFLTLLIIHMVTGMSLAVILSYKLYKEQQEFFKKLDIDI